VTVTQDGTTVCFPVEGDVEGEAGLVVMVIPGSRREIHFVSRRIAIKLARVLLNAALSD
jgi:hypothetical protein